jgi:hypothetical protein
MAIRTIEQLFGVGKTPQANIGTPNTEGQIIRFSKLNADLAWPQESVEDDSNEMGKSNEWGTEIFPVGWNTSGSMRKFLTAQAAQWGYSFALGGVTASDAYTSTIVPQDPVVDGIELPYFSALQQFRPHRVGGAPMDHLIVGCAIEEQTITINGGAGRQATQIAITFQGSGAFISPSGYTMPAKASEKQLQNSSASVLINGIDYIASANRGNLESMTLGVKNNIDPNSGYFIGSGYRVTGDPSSGAIRGRQEFMNRQYSMSLVVRMSNTTPEFTALQNLTIGNASVSLSGGPNDNLTVQHPRVAFRSVVLSDTNGIATLGIDVSILDDPALGPIIVTAQNSTIASLGM